MPCVPLPAKYVNRSCHSHRGDEIRDVEGRHHHLSKCNAPSRQNTPLNFLRGSDALLFLGHAPLRKEHMNTSAYYHLKVQHCCDMAQQAASPLEKECWLIVADSWVRLLRQRESTNHQSAKLVKPEAESVQPVAESSQPAAESSQLADVYSSAPHSVSFCQFSLVDRQVQSSLRPLRLGFMSAIRRR
jgi:hypothetical protein